MLWAMLGLGHARAGDEPPAAPARPIVTATRQNALRIPFNIPAPEQFSEVQLHVSTNQGATWELSSRAKPEKKGEFVSRAPHDGEYWYAIRAVDKQGVTRPEGTLQAQLKVNVDTVAPRLDISAARGEAGEIVGRWQAVDPNLKAESFKLEYRSDSETTWENVATAAPPTSMRHTLSGEATWWPKPSSTTVTVRASITDQAGNPATTQIVVKLNGPPAAAPVAGNSTNPAAGASSPEATRWAADRLTRDPLAHGAPDGNWRTADVGRTPRSVDRVPAQTVSQTSSAAKLDFGILPPGERARMVNSRSFELEYEIDAVGPSGVAKVELWGTRDGGRKWALVGADSDNQSPLPVNVPGEGIYGFSIVVQSNNGLGGRAPADGEMPEIWIGIDLTKPTARIMAADLLGEAGEVVIRWEASDELPEARPITLSFATAPAGPWTPIASGLENTGSYRWRLDSRLPGRVYLRLEVRDEAGNVAVSDLAEPLAIDRSRPAGHIRGVRPVASPEQGK